MRDRVFISLLLMVLLFAGQALAAVEFQLELQRQGSHFEARFVLSSDERLPQNLRPDFPDFKGFRVLSGPATGSSLSIDNGRASYEYSWTFLLAPQSRGRLRIDSASLKYGGRTYRSQARTVEYKGPSASGQDLHFVAELSTDRPVVGEMVLLRFKIYYNTRISGYDVGPLTSSSGFLAEPLQEISNPRGSTERYLGEDWNVAVLKEIALFPTREGELRLPSVTGTFRLPDNSRRQRRSLFDDFFSNDPFNRSRQLQLATEEQVLQVQPLPSGAPEGFSGVVGRYELQASPDKLELKAGEAITLQVLLKGEGNLDLLPLLEPQLSDGLELYDTQQETEINRRGKIAGRRSQQTLIVARESGRQQIGALRLPVFDPQADQYRILQAGPWEIKVLPGEASAVEGLAPIGRARGVTSYGEDIRHILDAPEQLEALRAPLHRSLPWRASLAGLVLLPALAHVAGRRRQAHEADPQARRYREAGKLAKRRLQAAQKALAGGQREEGLRLLDEALLGYLADRLGRERGGLILAEVTRELQGQGQLESALAEELLDFSKRLDLARFAGSADGSEQLPEQALGLLGQLRAALEGRKA